MGLLSDVEQRIDALVRRVFPKRAGDRVQPLEIAREMAKAMERQRTLSVDTVYVPNVFHATVHEDDLEALRPVLNTVKRDAANYVERIAAKRGYSFAGAVRLEISASERAEAGRVVVTASFDESGKAAPNRSDHTNVQAPAGDGADFQTRRYDALVAKTASPSPRVSGASAILEVVSGPETGRRLELKGERTYLIGRLEEADLALSDTRVSKRHAEISYRDGVWWLTDLDSTNGTRKNGRSIVQETLADGDQVAVGLTTLAFTLESERTKIGLDRV